jgi:RNA polymerase sigma-70 factor (ECF subfamily)
MLNFRGNGRMTALQTVKKIKPGKLPEVPSLVKPISAGPVQTCGVQGGVSEANVDQLLVERVQKGDKRAFDLLIQKYQHRIVSLVSRYVSDPSEAQDVAQEAFIKAYRAIKRFRGDSAFYTWLYRIAINTAKNWIVAKNRRPPASDIDATDAEQYSISSRLRETSTPERELLREEIEHTVFDTIAKLPEDLRTAIMLREMDGMSYEEIATTMECPIGTVRSRIFRAREAIDEKLKPLLGGHNNSGD